jgi:putative hemolysin
MLAGMASRLSVQIPVRPGTAPDKRFTANSPFFEFRPVESPKNQRFDGSALPAFRQKLWDTSRPMEIILIVPLIVLAGVFAMAEIALVSVRKPRLQQWADQGNSGAQTALDLANKPEIFLATVQMGMTLIGIFAGAFGERTLSLRIESSLNGIPSVAPYGHVISLVAVVGAVTYVTLIIGELVPKQIALHSPERFASALAKPMMALSRVGAPLVSILNASARMVLRVFRVRPSKEPLVTEEEIKVIMEQGAEAGLLEESEHQTVRRLFRLSDRAVRSLMKPRHDIVWLDADAPAEQTMQQVVASTHSRFPVARGSLDNIVGIAKEKDLLACCVGGKSMNVIEAAQPPLFVPGAIPAFRLLELFKKSQTHVALVVDEYGDVEGLVTINDFFEDLVGEVASADMPQERHAVQRADGSWLIDGKMLVHDFKELLNLGKLPGEDQSSYLTLGGLVMMQVGRVPVTGDSFEAAGLRFEVVDMDGKRVDKVLVQPRPSSDVGNRETRGPG